MQLLLALSPLLCFFLAEYAAGMAAGLWAAAALATMLSIVALRSPVHQGRLLELTALILFGVLAACVGLFKLHWAMPGMRMVIESVLMLVMGGSIFLGQPFSLGYTATQLRPEQRLSPRFLRMNYLISAAWTVALLVLVSIDAVKYLHPQAQRIATVAGVCVLMAVSSFTVWYPRKRNRLR